MTGTPAPSATPPFANFDSDRLQTTALWSGAVALLTVAIVLAYLGISQNGFHFDDWPNILDNASIRMQEFSFAALLDAARNAYLAHRPVASISFAIDWWRGNGSPVSFLSVNLLLHIITAWTVFALLSRTIATSSAKDRRVVILSATGAALWWAVQPIHVQAVSYVVQRMAELAALFSMLSVLAYLQARRSPRGAALWFATCFISFALAALSKENAWITPLLWLMAEYLVIRNDRPLIRGHVDRILLALPVIACVTLLADVAAHGPISRWGLHGYEGRSFTLSERLLTQPKVVLFHVSQILWPLPGRFSLEHDIDIVHSAASLHFWLPAALIASWTAFALWLAARRGQRIAAFWMLWLPITLAIESSFVPLEMVFEHRMYLPSVGFAGLIALGLSRLPLPPRSTATVAWSILVVVSIFSLWSTHQRIPQWRTETTLYQQAVAVAPHSARAWNHLGISLLNQRRNEPLSPEHYVQAIQAFTRATELDAKYAAPWTNRGVARWMHGDTRAAQSDLETAITLSEKEAAAFHYLFEIYQSTGREEDARSVRHRACFLGVRNDCYR